MISIIISSADPAYLHQLKLNIAETISAPYEIIAFDNHEGKMGICEVYNMGIRQAKYNILCFMHEDVIIKTNNWGPILKHIFDEHPEVGLLGVVGGGYKPLAPSSWGGLGINNLYANLLQSYKHSDKEPHHYYRNPGNTKLEYVACIDGVFLATTKKIAEEYKFDEATFKGFHGYDVDFSIAVGQKYKVAVTYKLLLHHLSEGSYSKTWMKENLKLHDKWMGHLPIDTQNFTMKQRVYIEKVTFRHFIKQMVKLKFPISLAYATLWKSKKYLSMDFKLFMKLQYYILKIYLLG